jgi:hypothetical protein
VLLVATPHATHAQVGTRPVDVQLAAIEYVLAEEVDEHSFCLIRPGQAYSYALARDSLDALPPPTRNEFSSLKAEARAKFGHQALSYCLSRPRTGFESDLERVLTYQREREARGRPYFGRTFWQVGPYGEPAVRISISQTQMLDDGRAVIGLSYVRGSGTTSLRCELRFEGSAWIVEDCTGFNLRA